MSNIMSQASVHKTLFLLEQMGVRLRAEAIKNHLPENPAGEQYRDHVAQAQALGAQAEDKQEQVQPAPHPYAPQAQAGYQPPTGYPQAPGFMAPGWPTGFPGVMSNVNLKDIVAAQVAAAKPPFTTEQVTNIEKEISDLVTKYFND